MITDDVVNIIYYAIARKRRYTIIIVGWQISTIIIIDLCTKYMHARVLASVCLDRGFVVQVLLHHTVLLVCPRGFQQHFFSLFSHLAADMFSRARRKINQTNTSIPPAFGSPACLWTTEKNVGSCAGHLWFLFFAPRHLGRTCRLYI